MLESIEFRPVSDKAVDVLFKETGGPTYSFDPDQLPGKMGEVMGKLLPALTAAKIDAEKQLASLEKEAATKDANLQAALAEIEKLKAQVVVLLADKTSD